MPTAINSLDLSSHINNSDSNNGVNNPNECGSCWKQIPNHLKIINCDKCKLFFHVKCCGLTQKLFKSIKRSNKQWFCNACELTNNNACDRSNDSNKVKSPCKKVKCGGCSKNIPLHLQKIIYNTCKKFYHVKCSGHLQGFFLTLKVAICHGNALNACILPFSQVDNND